MKLRISKWMLATMTIEALEEVIEKCKHNSPLQRMAKEELKSRPADSNGKIKSIEDYLE